MPGPFQTPQNERSFSALIDQALLDTGQLASLLSAISYGNAVIRECHNLGLFSQDMKEEQWLITSNPFILNRQFRWRRVRTMQVDYDKDYLRLKLPGRQLADQCQYYYAADDYYVIKFRYSTEIINTMLNTAIYYWPKRFMYYPRLGATNVAVLPGGNYTTRPAYWDMIEEQWMYLTADGSEYVTSLGDTTLEETARNLSMNWMIETNWEMILEGVKSRIFTLKGDPRAPTSYSQYKSMQADVRQSTGFESEDA